MCWGRSHRVTKIGVDVDGDVGGATVAVAVVVDDFAVVDG